MISPHRPRRVEDCLKKQDEKTPPPKSRNTSALRRALQEGEQRRLEYVASLHPREREALDPS
jgi:hypothetical protein